MELLSRLLVLSIFVNFSESENISLCVPWPHRVPNPAPGPDPLAPEVYRVTLLTSASTMPVIMEITREWSPLGADRFYQLVMDDYYSCAAFFRVVEDFVVQWGIAAEPEETAKWDTAIDDDPVYASNVYGSISFATAGPETRSTQVFINTSNNTSLDDKGFSPIGRVIQGMETILAIRNPTNESNGVDQDAYKVLGNEWIGKEYPGIDFIVLTEAETIVGPTAATEENQPRVSAPYSLLYQALGAAFLTYACYIIK